MMRERLAQIDVQKAIFTEALKELQ
jgi:hypothetical protein